MQEDPVAFRHYSVGATLDPTSFPAIETMQLGSGRLRVSYLGAGGLPFVSRFPNPVRDGLFDFVIDTQTGEGCATWLFADGKWRCAPRTWLGQDLSAVELHESSDCTGPQLLLPAPGSGCTERAPAGVFSVDTRFCAWFTVVEARAAEPTPRMLTTFSIGTPGACYPMTYDLPTAFYRVGAAVNPGDLFPEVERGPRN